jgi:hypothetical protein
MRILRDIIHKRLKENGATEVRKAAITPADLTGTFSLGRDVIGFWDKIVSRSPLLAAIGIRFTAKDYVYVNELTLGANGEDIIRPGVPGVDPGDTVTLGDNQRTFKLEEGRAVALLTEDLLEDTVEGDAVLDRILSMLSTAYANEVEKALWNGVLVGTANSSRGAFTGCFDGFLEQARQGGNIVDATAFSDRKPCFDTVANNKHFAALKTLPDKYYGAGLRFFAPPAHVWEAHDRLAQLGYATQDSFRSTNPMEDGTAYQGVPFFMAPMMRSNFLVKGTGTLATTGATTLASIAKARQAVASLTSATGYSNGAKATIGTDSAGTTFNLNAENGVETGAASGNDITLTSNLTYDHASGDYVKKFATAPTANGIHALLTRLENMLLLVHREMVIKFEDKPRTMASDCVISSRIAPALLNPDAAVLVRDFVSLT